MSVLLLHWNLPSGESMRLPNLVDTFCLSCWNTLGFFATRICANIEIILLFVLSDNLRPQSPWKAKKDAVKALYILQKFLESLDADHLWQSGDVPLSGCFQKLLLPPPYRSSLCSCTDQTLFENKGHWSSVMSRKKKKKLQSFHTLQHRNDFIIFCDIFGDLSCSIDYAGTGIIPQQQQNNFLKGPKLRERKKDTVACHHSKNFKEGEKEVCDCNSNWHEGGQEDGTSMQTGSLIMMYKLTLFWQCLTFRPV